MIFLKKKSSTTPVIGNTPIGVASVGEVSSEKVNVKKLILNHYPQIVMDIHEDFMTASDKALEEAYSIIREKSNEIEKGKRLEAIGFTNTNEVKQFHISESMLSVAKIIEGYKKKYPNYKFISYSDVKKICKKYSLIIGDISAYKGFVPEKNLRDIENFKVDNNDLLLVHANERGSSRVSDFGEKSYLFDAKEIEDLYSGKIDKLTYSGHYNYGNFSLNKMLTICAPQKDMYISPSERIENDEIINIPDPIVLQRVKGDGYLIVTAWGDEASDPLIAK